MESGSAAWGGGEGRGPKVRICYVCGRGYGLSSYEIHLKQCKAKWEATQERLPKSERKPLPKEPEAGDPLGGKGSLEAQNEAATQVFNTESLEACANCGRTFLKERLIIHQKSCTSSSPAKRVGAARLSSSDEQTTTTAHRPRTSRKSKTPPGHSSSGTQQDDESGLNSGQQGALAGNYGGIARRASRGLRESQGTPPNGSEQSAIELLERRIAQIEHELVNTKAEVKDLREIVDRSSLKAS